MLVAIVPIFAASFIGCERFGIWDKVLGLDAVEEVASRFDLSYAPNASYPVYPNDRAWKPLLGLIYKYSTAQLPKGREPKVVARSVALSSAKEDLGQGRIAEWTAPGTPFMISYRGWPGQTIPPSDYRIVGTIGDLHAWIARRRNDFHSNIMDFFLVLLGWVLAVVVWMLGSEETEKAGSGTSKV